jgi:ABC-2 type transport system permease protein
MRLYIELARKSFQRQVAYRSATLAGWVTNLFFGMLRASIFIAVYGPREAVAGYTLQDAITYTAFTQALIAAVALWGWFDMIRSIKSGEVASDLSKPFDYYGFWLAQDIGRGLYQFIARGLTIMIAYLFFFRISIPGVWEQWLLVAITLALAILLSFAWRFLISALAFWTTDAIGLARMAYFLVLFPSGFAMPIAFMPDWLQSLCRATPFPGFVDTPVAIYLGRAQGAEALGLILQQLIWMIALMALGRLLAEAGRRKLTIQGG